MKLVVVESPYAGNVEWNLLYVRAAMAHCLRRGESPYASHALYTQPGVLDDLNPEERRRGILAGFAWARTAIGSHESTRIAFYCDLGWSPGMVGAVRAYYAMGARMERRFLGAPWSTMIRNRDECFPPDGVLAEFAHGETWGEILPLSPRGP